MRQFLLFIFCSTALLFTSCQKKSKEKAEDFRVVHLNLRYEPPTLDPRKGSEVIASHMHFLLFEGLVKLNHDRSIIPAQAESYEISEDGTVYTFKLRGTHWSDGSPVTAYDFEKSWKDIVDPAFPSQNAFLLYPIKNAEAVKQGKLPLSALGLESKDEKTFVVTLEKPTPYFLDLISFCVFFPVQAKTDSEFPDWACNAGEHYVSNGPFILKEWKHHNELIAVRNPHYWDKERVLPDEIHFSMVANETTALQMFENGQLDMVGEPLSPLPVDALPALLKTGKVQKFHTAATSMIAFNVDSPPFNNSKIRRALGLAIHREEIVKNITQMQELVALNAVPPILKKDVYRAFFRDHDVETAKKLFEEGLAETGFSRKDFSNFAYCYATSDIGHKVAQAIQQQWQNVLGVHITLEGLENKTLMERLTQRNYTLAQTQWVAQYSDQMNILERYKYKQNVKNYAGWEDQRFIELLDRSFYEDPENRMKTLEEAEEIFLEAMPISPLYHWNMTYIVQPYLKNVGITPIGDLVFEDFNIHKEMR